MFPGGWFILVVVALDRSYQVGNVHGHLVDVRAVELLDIAHGADVVASDKVDRNTLAPETTSTTNSAESELE